MWNRAEAAVSLMDDFLEDLDLKPPPRSGRVSAPGVPVPEIDEMDEVQDHWAQDEETHEALLNSARQFAVREQVEFDGAIRAYLEALGEVLKEKAPRGLRTMESG